MDLLPNDELLYSIKNKFFIISLPRTGTKSLCKMFYLMGYGICHCPSVRLANYLNVNAFDCYADTPIYRPSLIKQLVSDSTNKFVYIDRDCDEWVVSFENVNLHMAYTDYMSRDLNTIKPVSKLDRDSLIEIFGGNAYNSELAATAFRNHRQHVLDIIPSNQLLVYRFIDGWEPLCRFMGKDIPSYTVPHLNKKVLFDKIT